MLRALAGAGRGPRARHPHARLRLAGVERGGRQRAAALGAELDPPADRARAGGDRGELGGEPVRRRLGVGVRGGDEPVGAPEREQPLARDRHPVAAGVADAGRARLEQVQPQAGRGVRRGAGALGGRVEAAVEHEQDLVRRARHAGLRRERADAGADERLLVARGHDDARDERGIRRRQRGPHGSGAPVSTSSRPRS